MTTPDYSPRTPPPGGANRLAPAPQRGEGPGAVACAGKEQRWFVVALRRLAERDMTFYVIY